MNFPKFLTAAVLAAGLWALAAPASRASEIGNERWCAVVDQGAGEIVWDCEYETVEDCTPAVLQGNRGFCQINPYWKDPNKKNG